ncbi:MAG: hypothetical protein LUO93_03010, partial [Methanomicrobiales archaeon]|nr:hypothetical protein [Methanomicrobiales archaeon]
MLRPSRRVAVPLAMPRYLTGTAHAMQLRGLGDPSFNLPTIPGMPAMPSISLLKVGNLWMVDPAAQPALRGILGMMTFQFNPTPPVQDPAAQNGTLVFVAGQVEGDGAGQIDTYINAGFAALVSTASISTGKLSLLFTQQPSVVATLAGGSSPSFVLLSDQPSAVVTAANKLAGGIAPP